MKKSLISLCVLILGLFILASCAKGTSDLSLSGYTSTYKVGDTFSTAGLKVEAVSGDKTIDVTSDAQIDSSGVNMAEPGVYAVIVSYDGIIRTYYVTVSLDENVETLVKLDLDTTKARTSYMVGETFSSSGLGLIATYDNSNYDEQTSKYLTDLTGFTITIKDDEGNTVTGAFNKEGTYEVQVSKDGVSASFNVTVTEGASSISDAVNIAVANKGLVAGGESINSDPNTNNYYGRVTTSYEFGPNLNSLTYKYDGNNYTENYFLNSEGEIVGLRVNEDFDLEESHDQLDKPLTMVENITSDFVDGMDYTMFNGTSHYAGAEALLAGLYELAKTNPNRDLEETITKETLDDGSSNYIYNFHFGYLVEAQKTTVFYLHIVDVTFSLGEGNFLEDLAVSDDVYYTTEIQTQFKIMPKRYPSDTNYDENLFYAEDRILPDGTKPGDTNSGYPSDFPVLTDAYTISDCIGRLKSAQVPSSHYSCSYNIHQYKGERDAINKYPEEEVYVTNYDVYVKTGDSADDYEKIDDDNLVFNTEIDNENNSDRAIELKLDNFNSELAKTTDTIYFVYKDKNIGNFTYDDFPELRLYYSYSENTVRIRFYAKGTFTLYMCTIKTKKTITVNVDYRDPLTFKTQVFQNDEDPNLATFIQKSEVNCFVNDVIYFNALPNETGDPSFKATSDKDTCEIRVYNTNSSSPIPSDIPEALSDYEGPFASFTSSVVGTYVITLTSTREGVNVSSTLKINVESEPDFSEKLTGTYVFDVTTSNSEIIEGRIIFTLDPDQSGASLIGYADITVGEFNERISFNYQNRAFSNVEYISGDNGRISLILDENLDIIIAGSYNKDDGTSYFLNNVILVRQEG